MIDKFIHMIKEIFQKHKVGSFITMFASIITILYFITGIPSLPYLFNIAKEASSDTLTISSAQKTSSNSILTTDKIISESKYDYDTRKLLDFVINKSNLAEVFDYSPRNMSFFKNNSIPLKDTATFAMLDSSEVLDFGFLTNISNNNYFYGHYSFKKLSTDKNADKVECIVIFEGNNDKEVIHPIIFKINIFGFFVDAGFGTPEVVNSSFDKILFIPVYTGGNGVFNDHQYYLLSKNSYHKIESESWKKVFENKLQNGDHTMNGIEVNLKTMTSKISIWKKDDPHCCPTGGNAIIKLALMNNQFQIDSYKILPKED